jgi:hypothetical protein
MTMHETTQLISVYYTALPPACNVLRHAGILNEYRYCSSRLPNSLRFVCSATGTKQWYGAYAVNVSVGGCTADMLAAVHMTLACAMPAAELCCLAATQQATLYTVSQ